MQRSRSRTLKNSDGLGRVSGGRRLPLSLKRAPIAAAIMAAIPRAYAAPEETGGLEEVVVTATKRAENLQNVPLSITAIGTEKLDELHIAKFDDYVKYLPSVSFQGSASGGGASGPGFTRIFMRGVSSGDNGNHSGPLPTVGTYLDEQPITTIQGALDIHIYDIARVEALAGPQGTLYGASSEAGTVRIITNKPDPQAFKAAYDMQGTTVRGQGGYLLEGFINMPLSPTAAVRLVGWSERDGGYIDNVPNPKGPLTYQSSGGLCLSNTNPPAPGCSTTPTLASNRFNTVQTNGARAALRVELNDSWTITPTLMGQKTDAHGIFTADPAVGDLATSRYYRDSVSDKWGQLALTLEGKISNFDLTYAGAFLKRDDVTSADYTDYSLYYDRVYGSGHYFTDGSGAFINPSQYILANDGYRKQSHEFRIATPRDNPLRFIGGLFFQRQQHNIQQDYVIDALPVANSVTGWPHAHWLTKQERVDRDYAAFGEFSYDFVPNHLTLTAGYRFFRYNNSIEGFFGFGLNNVFGSSTGENSCFAPPIVSGTPCTDLNRSVSGHGGTPRFNLTYKIDDNAMAYATYSRGFRPGGINRRTQAPPLPPLATYASDFLKNYEIGWKTSWLGNHLRFNGAFFWEDWSNFQFSFLGPNSFTIVRNAGGARIKGVETEIEWAPSGGLALTVGATRLDPKLTENFCIATDTNGIPLPLFDPTIPAPPQGFCQLQNAVPSGSELPGTPKFKGNLTARYTFGLHQFDAHVQGSFVYQSDSTSALAPSWAALIGNQPAYGIADFFAGVERNNLSFELFVSNAFDRRAQLYRYSECPTFSPLVQGTPTTIGAALCGSRPHVGINTPRTIGVRFGQRF